MKITAPHPVTFENKEVCNLSFSISLKIKDLILKNDLVLERFASSDLIFELNLRLKLLS